MGKRQPMGDPGQTSKTSAKILIKFVTYACIGATRIFGKQDIVGLISPDIPISNLGDQALLCGAVNKVLELNRKLLVISAGPEPASQALDTSTYLDKVKFVDDLYIAFATPMAYWERLRLLWILRRCELVYFIGADVMDGTYSEREVLIKLELANHIASLGIQVNIISCSFSDVIEQSVAHALKALDQRITIYARDENSQIRVKKYAPDTKLAADIAFFLRPEITSEKQLFKKRHREVIGVCLKNSDFELTLMSQQDIIASLKYWAMKDVGFIFLPHHPEDLRIANQICDHLDKDSIVWLPSEMPSASAIKSNVQYCDLVLTGRMHVAIAALGTARPVLCFTYAGKFEGLLKHFLLPVEEMTINGETDHLEYNLRTKIGNLLDRKDQFSEEIRQQLPNVLELAAANFSSLR